MKDKQYRLWVMSVISNFLTYKENKSFAFLTSTHQQKEYSMWTFCVFFVEPMST